MSAPPTDHFTILARTNACSASFNPVLHEQLCKFGIRVEEALDSSMRDDIESIGDAREHVISVIPEINAKLRKLKY